MPAEGNAVHQFVLLGAEERVGNAFLDDGGAERCITRCQPFGAGDDVGLDVEVLGAEPLSDATKAADDFVHDEHDAGAVAQLAHLAVVVRVRHDAAARVLHRFEDDGRHCFRAFLFDERFEFPLALQVTFAFVHTVRAAIVQVHRRMTRARH